MVESMTWRNTPSEIDADLDERHWWSGPELHAKEVDRLTFCCCECCHGYACQGLSEGVCGAFPQHSTSNQLFTPAMFTAYHGEGYRACLEAKAAEILNKQSTTAMSVDQIGSEEIVDETNTKFNKLRLRCKSC